MSAFPLASGGSLVLGTAGQPEVLSGTSSADVIIGADAGETLFGGEGNDILFGGGGTDTFFFARTTAPDQVDVVLDFHSGEDHLQFHNVSDKEVTLHDTAQGLEIWYVGLGGVAPEHGVALLWGVHQLQPNDFAFSSGAGAGPV